MARMALVGLVLGFYLVSGMGCNQGESDDEKTPTDTRYAQGETLAEDWCATAQMHLAALEGTSLDKTKIEQSVPASTSELTLAKAGIDETKDSPIRIVAFAQQMGNTAVDDAPETLSTHIICKTKSQEGIKLPGSAGAPFQIRPGYGILIAEDYGETGPVLPVGDMTNADSGDVGNGIIPFRFRHRLAQGITVRYTPW